MLRPPIESALFRSRKFLAALRDHRLVGSMGQVASTGDNAAMESFFALLQKNHDHTGHPSRLTQPVTKDAQQTRARDDRTTRPASMNSPSSAGHCTDAATISWPGSPTTPPATEPTEAISGRLQHLRKIALDFRNLTNCRI